MKIICLGCDKEKEHKAFGLCNNCYHTQWRNQNKERDKAYQKKSSYSKGNRCSCGKSITNNAKRCKSCWAKTRIGEKNPAWKGGIKKTNNRVYIHCPGNPMSDIDGYVARSRLVMSQMIGRPLKPEEIVHHLDRNSMNDSEENLILFENRAQHFKSHWRRI